MRFHPPDVPVPEGMRDDRLLLRPLRATDVDADYDAVMSSRAMLRAWSQTSWPAEDFPREENLRDLERHEREHVEGSAFTYTVFDPTSTRCLGCVYITRLEPSQETVCPGGTYGANVGFWVRASEIPGDLDRHLFSCLRSWFASDWGFDTVVFTIAPEDVRQATLFTDAGLKLLGEVDLPGGRRGRVFGQGPARRPAGGGPATRSPA